MSKLSDFLPGMVKSTQRGVIAIAANASSGTATVSAVVTNKSRLSYLGARGADNTFPQTGATLVLTNATTITAQREASAGAAVLNVSWELTEFY